MQLVKRAFDVVGLLSRNPDGMTFQQLCDGLDIPGASMHRLLAVLRDEEFITRSDVGKRYFIGPAAWEIGSRAQRFGSLVGVGEETLPELADEVGETVLLTELVDVRAMCTARFDPDRTVALSAQVGQSLPFHAAASARTLLVDLQAHQIGRLLSGTAFTSFTPRTPRNVHDVLRHLRLTRLHGFGISYNEFDSGVWALSVPVRNGTRQVVAAITVACSATRMSRKETRTRAQALALGAAERLGAEVGHHQRKGRAACTTY
jgi:IclR family transcriptional regulator, acetate operon repressor